MMENIQGRLKMEFTYYNCFSLITKLILGLHTLHIPKSIANDVVVLKDRHFDASYLYSFHVYDMKRMCAKIW